ncbi:MAG: single-stranded-DNA-specific exonuclease RecJ [Candidatus Doudnabacteria bacterium]|nr:single-stranded-DNA-specific exonuclease RecJ [Candidatus Doudnabacteria bacterium]
MKQWKIKEIETKNPVNLPEYPNLIVKLLNLRGLSDSEQIYDFLNPDYNKLHDPFRFLQMQTAVSRIKQAIERQEKVTVYADYDADAITALSVVHLGLKKLGLNTSYYIPDRFAEGYGMNLEAIKALAADGTKLIITVDCGINAVEEAALCQELGVDLIITDHHELTGELPNCLAVINPKNPSDEYPFPYLTGVGVAYKLIQALGLNGYEKWLLDLVAIGTVADCQSLTGENRILVSYGLKVLAKTRHPGLRALLSLAGLEANSQTVFDTFTLGFVLAPRINAAGRIKHGNAAFQLLVAQEPNEAKTLALELNQLNQHRQNLTQQILSEAKAQIELTSDKKVLMAVGKDWPKGVVGLVAGKLAEEYNRPVLAISNVEGISTGSARSIIGFDMVAALGSAKDLLQKYGGHTQAAGFTLNSENLVKFNQRLLEYADSLNLTVSDAVIEVDAEVQPADISWENFAYLEKLAPFGYGNAKPKFIGRDLEVLDCKSVGSDNKHAKLKVKFGQHNLEAICFGQGFLVNSLRIGARFDCVFELIANQWNGNRNLQLKILDTKVK